MLSETDLHSGEHERGSRTKQQQAPDMLQLPCQAKSDNTVQQGRQQPKQQASNTPLQPALYAPVIQPPTPCVWQSTLVLQVHDAFARTASAVGTVLSQ